nr:ribbon-helix-helix protein, CopG family [uncultured Desulfobacter sp.]
MVKIKKVNTSLRLDKNVLKEFKILAIEKETSIQAIIETLILEYIEKNKGNRSTESFIPNE